jgi:hypothetical protein
MTEPGANMVTFDERTLRSSDAEARIGCDGSARQTLARLRVIAQELPSYRTATTFARRDDGARPRTLRDDRSNPSTTLMEYRRGRITADGWTDKVSPPSYEHLA